MKVTNRFGLPDALVRAVAADPYSKGACEFSVTELLAPARQRALTETYKEEMTEDVADRLFSLYGQIAHLILERANVADLAEKRFFATVAGARISGQLDSLHLDETGAGVTLTDWKFTSAAGFYAGKEPKPEWVAQLNFQLELLRQNGLDAKTLQIGGLLRDYSKAAAERSKDYPEAPVVLMPIPLWPREKTIAVMQERINAHREAREGMLPACTSEERWEKAGVWAVMREGRKSAVRLFDNEAEAKEFQGGVPSLTVVFRPGESTRCKSYCPVKNFCAQWSSLSNQVDKNDKT
jgi:hypothetical protein